MKLLIISCLTILSILFSGCDAYETHKQIEKEKQIKERTFTEEITNKEIKISSERIIQIESDKPGFYSVYSDRYIKGVSSEKVLDDFIIKIIVDRNQFNFSGKKMDDREIIIKANEEENDFILKSLK